MGVGLADHWYPPEVPCWLAGPLEEKEEVSIQLEHNEEAGIQKHEERLRNLWDNFKGSNIWIIGMPEGEEEIQEIENLFKKIMKENFPNLAKETDFQEV